MTAVFARVNTSRNRNFVLEILMIVVGINIALWFEGWFDDLKDAETEQQYLAGLRDDLASDLKLLDSVIESNSANLQQLGEIVPDLPNLGDASPEAPAPENKTPEPAVEPTDEGEAKASSEAVAPVGAPVSPAFSPPGRASAS